MSDKTVRIVTRVIGDEYVGDYNYAVITLNAADIQWLLERIAQAKELTLVDAECYALVYFNYSADYYEKLWIPDEDGNQCNIEYGELYVLPAGFTFELEQLPIAAATVIVQDTGVLWAAQPKHDSGHFETETLSEEFLREQLATLEGVS